MPTPIVLYIYILGSYIYIVIIIQYYHNVLYSQCKSLFDEGSLSMLRVDRYVYLGIRTCNSYTFYAHYELIMSVYNIFSSVSILPIGEMPISWSYYITRYEIRVRDVTLARVRSNLYCFITDNIHSLYFFIFFFIYIYTICNCFN